MTVTRRHPVFTVGHSNHTPEAFLALLARHQIQALADVRSVPYSQHYAQFNREVLQHALKAHGMAYVFLGEELGARRAERECYVDGRADYRRIAATTGFRRGIERIEQGAAKLRLALMCAEREPLECHRCVLISPRLVERGVEVIHILGDGSLERHEATERRLLALFDRSAPDLFLPESERVTEAYERQGSRIAYEEEEVALRETPPRYGD